MHGSKLSLSVWFWAAYLMATHSNGISALQLQRQLGLSSYKTAWVLCAKLRVAMVDPQRNPLAGLLEIDETTIHYRHRQAGAAGGFGRSPKGKLLIAGACEIKGKGPGRLRLAHITNASASSLHGFIAANIAPQSTARTDGWPAYPGAPNIDHQPRSSDCARPMRSCPGSTACSQTSRPGRSASTTAYAPSISRPTSTSSSSASTAGDHLTPPSYPLSPSQQRVTLSPTRC